jgi:hypothetical protein
MKLLGNNRLLFIDYVELILYYTKETFLNWGNPVSKFVRILLLIVGLILLLLAIAALAFAFWPDSFVRESIQLPASLFTFPGK